MKKVLPVLNISQFPADHQEQFYANDFANHVKAHHRDISKPHKHDFYLIVLFTKGSGNHEVDFQKFEIKPGTVFMLNPGQTHHWEFSPDTDGYVIFHTKAFYDLTFSNKTIDNFPFFYSLQNSPYLELKEVHFPAVKNLFEEILKEHRTKMELKHQKISSLLDVLYIELTRAYTAGTQSSKNSPGLYLEKVRQLEKLIDENYLRIKSASGYADMMHMSTRHLNRVTNAVLAKTISDLILERILLEAQRILSSSRISVGEVSEMLGYEDASYFSKIFRKKLQLSPSEFAARYR